jgi:6-pyruvoyl-tetrahydropterin synthase
VWAVQFSIDINDINVIIDSLKKEFDCSLLNDVENFQVSSAGVITSKGKINLQGSEIPIKKQEYKDWKTASFYFNWKESVYAMNNNALIKKIETRLKDDGLKVILIDYGIRNLE